jgi:hypothetical protein
VPRHRRVSRGRRIAGCVAAGALVASAVSALAVWPSGGKAVAGSAAKAAGPAKARRQAAPTAWPLRLAIHYLPSQSNRSQYDAVVAVTGATWFLGGSNVGGTSAPEAERLRNGIPHSFPFPLGTYSWIVAADSASPDDIWAVTYLGGSVLHWNGQAWATAGDVGGPGTRLTGITAIRRDDVWAFGATGTDYPGAGTWHYDGATWTRVRGAAAGLVQAAAVAPSDIWGVGHTHAGSGVLSHFNGTRWERATPTPLAGMRYTHVLALARDSVWVAGTIGGKPVLGHYDGHSWATLFMPGKIAPQWMCSDGSGGLWVVANSGHNPSVMLHRSAASTWTTVRVSSSAVNRLLACALAPGTPVVWGAGVAAAPHGSAAAAFRHG